MLLQLPVAGSYNSALLKSEPLYPPATSTLPLGSSVAVCRKRAVPRLPVAVHVPVAGSYSSMLLKIGQSVCPPATSTLPSVSSVVVWWVPAASEQHTAAHLPLADLSSL